MLEGKNILLGITGGIAAYKAAILVRLLVKAGANVQVVMTPDAHAFVTPLTLATLSKRPVLTDFYEESTGDWNSHVDLGLWADLVVVAPVTANTMGKMAHGIADNLLAATYLSAKCPVVLAPSMDLDMYRHPSTRKNVEILKSYGNYFMEAASGELASGLSGEGRMQEPETIINYLYRFFPDEQHKALTAYTFLVTAGPTYEKMDPVRFIGNFSSGKMGFAIANELAGRGANVVLIAGPTALQMKHPRVTRIDVTSADEMYREAIRVFPETHGAVMAAAVSDYTVEAEEQQKMKRKGEDLQIKLKPTQDIAAALGQAKGGRLLVGFALETQDEEKNALRKINDKNLDFIILNSLRIPGAGFQVDTNKIIILEKDGTTNHFDLKSKREVAADIVDKMVAFVER